MLTVYETLEYGAMLRMRTTSKASVKDAVNNTISVLGLKDVEHVFVGTSETRTLSNGQLRRLTIGVEVVYAPALIFLDEVLLFLYCSFHLHLFLN
jgi:ABC-type multidrug transport system ATPase subunit